MHVIFMELCRFFLKGAQNLVQGAPAILHNHLLPTMYFLLNQSWLDAYQNEAHNVFLTVLATKLTHINTTWAKET